MTKIVSAQDAVAAIRDEAVISVSSSSALGCPDAVLSAIGERFRSEGHPRNLTTLHPIAAGDMYGVRGIDHLAQDGLLTRILAGSYPSGPSSLPMPMIWKMIVEERVAAYNVPSGLLYDMHRDAATHRPGVLTKVGLETFVDPIQQGCAMNARAQAQPIVHRVEFDNDTWLHFPNIPADVAIIRATTADPKGNLTFEHEGATLGALEQAISVRNNGGLVIAQVKRLAAAGSMRPHDVRVPGNMVDLIVVAPDQTQTTETFYDPAISGEIMRPLDSFELVEHGVEKIIARCAALHLADGDAVNIGFGVSAAVPRILLEEGYPEAVTWAVEQGATGGVPLTGFAFGCASNADAFLSSPNQFTYFQGGGFDASLLSFLEVDRHGNVNVSKLAQRPYLTAGCGGFVDITANARKIVFSGLFEVGAHLDLGPSGLVVSKPGKSAKFVEQVEHITFSGPRGLRSGQEVIFVTERCTMRMTPSGVTATNIMPGIDPQRDIVDASRGVVSLASNAALLPVSILQQGKFGLEL